ncbi:MATH domain and coiled-coil domain-containing protein At3g44790-like [Arabidopsis lyrata subsp. lyrata]|uniref:MATH domain and coiled-coil domain-containing protein At3g44790-like n=1 Tax=Arabidopsis lyrata subsp. lyrata TaxID=81972 RepID=UPI000A29AEE9|nr:MATH domain and coiled-coil domain-containing protein At3g44790-like [Arabidopsis lyrata subsp. lyrata]|eukprot:XP_020881824.1 MATH domain and coiled-coil domain-containing protein At3g44790-like [Arabidopsis lyrata subsp. lyrata]
MGNEKFTWVIKNFSSLGSKSVSSDEFVFGGCKWFLMGYQNANYLALFLVVAGFKTLHGGWNRLINYRLTVVNQVSEKLSQQRGQTQCWLDRKNFLHGYQEMISLTKLNAKEGGFLVKNEVKIVAEVYVLQVIGNLDVLEGSQDVTKPLKRIRLNDDGAASSHLQTMDVNGFQVESVKRIFESHPEMALMFRAKNQQLRTSCINVLLNLIETMCVSLQDLSIYDLGQAEQALTYLNNSGFKVEWLERKLEEVKEKKMEEHIGKSRMQELENDLKVFKQKCSDIEDLLEKEKEELKNLKKKCSDTEDLLEKEKTKVLAAARAPPLTLNDFV